MQRKRIFISHISNENQLAQNLKQRIGTDFLGLVDIFVSSDQKTIQAGSKWLEEVEKGLKRADLQIIMCSKESVGRPWVNFEAGAVWLRDIPVIPVCHSGMHLGDLPVPLSMLEGVECSNPEGIKKLYDAIATLLKVNPPAIDFNAAARDLSELEKKYMQAKEAIEVIGKQNEMTADGIPSMVRIHRYSGEWKITTNFLKWQDQLVKRDHGDRVVFDGSMFLLLSADGQRGSGAQIGELHVSIGKWSAIYQIANLVTNARLDQDGSLHIYVQVLSRTRIKGNPPVPPYRDELFGKGSFEVELNPSRDSPKTLTGGHNYPSGYPQEAEETYKHESFFGAV